MLDDAFKTFARCPPEQRAQGTPFPGAAGGAALRSHSRESGWHRETSRGTGRSPRCRHRQRHQPDAPGCDAVLTVPERGHTLPAMEPLHAPWRIQYILGPKIPPGEGSLFSRIAQSNEDEANFVIARERTCFAMLNRYPYTGGHLMVIPYKEVQDLGGLTDGELLELMKLLRRCQDALAATMKPDGYNIGINLGKVAGAGIEEHLHLHLVPRWNGDTNFMPVLGSTTVVPEALQETAAKLRRALAGS